jgi:hypothetical protein
MNQNLIKDDGKKIQDLANRLAARKPNIAAKLQKIAQSFMNGALPTNDAVLGQGGFDPSSPDPMIQLGQNGGINEFSSDNEQPPVEAERPQIERFVDP